MKRWHSFQLQSSSACSVIRSTQKLPATPFAVRRRIMVQKRLDKSSTPWLRSTPLTSSKLVGCFPHQDKAKIFDISFDISHLSLKRDVSLQKRHWKRGLHLVRTKRDCAGKNSG